MIVITDVPEVCLIELGTASNQQPIRTSSESPFNRLNGFLERKFYKPDLRAIRIVLGAIKSHYLKVGDPAWLFVVAPPGAGKSTISIMGAANLPEVKLLGDITESTFLSGFYGHQQPGLLEKLGQPTQKGSVQTTEGNAVLLVKDFTTVLSMRREKRGVILGQLREIHDGEFRRDFGTGETKVWKGRITVIAAVTPALDRHYSIFGTLGERFLQLKWHRPDSEEAGERAISQQGQEGEIREESCEIIGQIMEDSIGDPPGLPQEMKTRIASLGEILAIGRTHVYRSSYGNREIEYVPEAEANTRISKGLAAIAKGVAALSRRTEVAEEDIQDAFRVGLDSLPETRRKILLAAVQGRDLDSVEVPRSVRDRAAEELAELGILRKGVTLELSEKAEQLVSKANPECPVGTS